jgi:hypothetical protein
MKSLKQFVLLILLVIIVSCNENLKKRTEKKSSKSDSMKLTSALLSNKFNKNKDGDEKSDKITIETTTVDANGITHVTKETIQAGPAINELFAELFEDPERNTNHCDAPSIEEGDDDLNKYGEQEGEGKGFNVPSVKRNKNADKQIGQGLSAYLFDYLDELLFKPIITEFQRIWTEASKKTPFEGYIEPYDWYEIIRQNFGGQLPTGEDDLFAKIKSLQPSFNSDVYKTSLTMGQLERIIKEWNWSIDQTKANPVKALLDKYDYNGDGRLSAKEFLIAMIKTNKKVWDTIGLRACNNCMIQIIQQYIDPIYNYSDCSNSNQIGAESLWRNFEYLKTNKGKYNIYICQLDTGAYRTTSLSDFVMKSQKTVEGKLSKDEFRKGILMGYWLRNVSDGKVDSTGALSGKLGRWTNNGETDTICKKISDAKGK